MRNPAHSLKPKASFSRLMYSKYRSGNRTPRSISNRAVNRPFVPNAASSFGHSSSGTGLSHVSKRLIDALL